MARKSSTGYKNKLNQSMVLMALRSFFIFIVLSSFHATAVATTIKTDGVTEEELDQVAGKLEKFIDRLPKLKHIKGYTTTGNGEFAPAHLTIGMYMKKWKFHKHLPAATVFAFGTSRATATIPGPSIVAMAGVKTYVRWENHLPDKHIFTLDKTLEEANPKVGVPTVVHLHGAVSEPQSDGSALAWFTKDFKEKGKHWEKSVYEYENDKETSNMWYHDHAIGYTRLNLLAGLIGAYKVINPALEVDTWNLPHKTFDRQLVIMDRAFTKDGLIYMNSTGNNPTIHPQWQPEYFGDAIIVNGKAWPYMNVQRKKYRFRIINASNARFFSFALDNGMGFTKIGSDSFYLEKPIYMTEILLAPSEIVDVIIDFADSETDEVILTNSASYPFPDGDEVNESNNKVMKFKVLKKHVKDKSHIPANLVEVQKLSLKGAIKDRYILLNEFESPTDEPTHLLINFKKVTDPVTEKPKNGTTEVWHVINLTDDNHPFHVHLAGFQVVSQQELMNVDELKDCVVQNKGVENCNLDSYKNGTAIPPPADEAGWKNVFKMQPGYITTILVRFTLTDSRPFPFDPSGEPGYAYHCHILDHEDNEMMRPFKIVL